MYALMLVNWVERNYFQVQSEIFKCSLVMIYLGHFSPFVSRLAGTVELINEVLIVICTYHLIMFTALVYDPGTRYLCGWPCIVVVFTLIAINLSVIVYQSIS